MLSSRNLLPLVSVLALASSGCEIVADFDREKINQSNITAPEDLPKIPSVPAEKPQPGRDAGLSDAGADAGADPDAGNMDGGADLDAGSDAGRDGGEDASVSDAGDSGTGDASADSGS